MQMIFQLRLKLIFFAALFPLICKAQTNQIDTIVLTYSPEFAYRTKDLEEVQKAGLRTFKFTSEQDPKMKFSVSIDKVLRIGYADGRKFINDNPVYPNPGAASYKLRRDKQTGEIRYSDVLNFPGKSKDNLFDAYRRLIDGNTEFQLSQSDDEGNWLSFDCLFYRKKTKERSYHF